MSPRTRAKRTADNQDSPSTSAKKVQRWIDLLTTLLSHHYAVTFRELAAGVPAYMSDGTYLDKKPSDAVKRMFERDKLDLRTLGVPIESVGEDGDEESRYRLRAADFYMPYLGVVGQRGTTKPKRVDRHGYHAITDLTFDAEELLAVAEGAARARQLGDPVLRADVDSAVRKLAVDLPLGAASAGEGTYVTPASAQPDPAVFEALSAALFAQKRVAFDYHSMGRDETSRRTIEPYGLFFLNSHWYLVGCDAEKGALRNFRVSRIARVKANAAKPGTPDFTIPKSFSLREHARARSSWELGDDAPLDALVEVRGESGAARAAAALGMAVGNDARRRRFTVRRADVFARWLLSFAGELVPLSPPPLVDEYLRQVAATRAVYAGAGAS